MKDGKVNYSVMTDEYKQALTFINKLYAEGLLDTQTFTQDSNQFAVSLNNEEHLCYPCKWQKSGR
ncbi:MAG: hypothetical protein ACLR6I_00695 [Waltera sp.]